MSNNTYHHVGAQEFCTACGKTRRCYAVIETPGRIDCRCKECWDDLLGRAYQAREEARTLERVQRG